MKLVIIWLVLSTLAAIGFATMMYSDDYQAIRMERIENYKCTRKEKILSAINGFVMGFLLWPILILSFIAFVICEGGNKKCR